VSPYLHALRAYEGDSSPRTFNEDLSWYLEHGFVFSRPDFFVMGRPVAQYAGYALITGLHRFPSHNCDCWHVHLMGGNLAPVTKVLPWPLPLVSFERNNRLRFHTLANIHRLLGNNQS